MLSVANHWITLENKNTMSDEIARNYQEILLSFSFATLGFQRNVTLGVVCPHVHAFSVETNHAISQYFFHNRIVLISVRQTQKMNVMLHCLNLYKLYPRSQEN